MKMYEWRSVVVAIYCLAATISLTRSLAMPSPLFPAADMDLKLRFDFSTPISTLDTEGVDEVEETGGCFEYLPYTPFQGGSVAVGFDSTGGTGSTRNLPDLSVTIRFISTGSGSIGIGSGNVSCLHIGSSGSGSGSGSGNSGSACGVEVQSEWQWERQSGVFEHIINDYEGVVEKEEEWRQGQEIWEICVVRSKDSASLVAGVITLLQNQHFIIPIAERSTITHMDLAIVDDGGVNSYRDTKVPRAQSPPVGSEARFSDYAAKEYFATSTINRTQVDIFVNSLVDAAVNISLCYPFGSSCSLRSAMAACESLLVATTSPVLCSVHLPSQGRVTLDPALKELYLNDTRMNGTLAIVGNGCYVSPNVTSLSTMRFLHIDFQAPGGSDFSLELSNLTISGFGDTTLVGGALWIKYLVPAEASHITDVVFEGNKGVSGGAVHVSHSEHLFLTGCTFVSNFALYYGGGIFLDQSRKSMISFCFFGEHSAYGGGGIYVNSNNNNISIISCDFDSNVARDGGGVYVFKENLHVIFEFCYFANNTATSLGGAGMFVDAMNDYLEIKSCKFVRNMASFSRGGGVFFNSNNNYASVSDSLFEDNFASYKGGGGLFIDDSNRYFALIACNFLANHADAESGGGLFISSNNDDLIVSSCLFSENTASINGGGLYVDDYNVNMKFLNLTFINNIALEDGGGVYIGRDNDLALWLGCNFTNNAAINGRGGGVNVESGNIYTNFSSCIFEGNFAEDGGGVHVYSNNKYMIFSSCTFANNSASALGGGGIYVGSGNNHLLITYCLFVSNTALPSSGGGVSIVSYNEQVTITFCVFKGNSAHYKGGGGLYIDNFNRFLAVTDCIFSGNRAELVTGGAIYINTNNDDLTLSSCTFTDNVASEHGGGIYMDNDNVDSKLSNLTIRNNVAHKDGGGAYFGLYNDNLEITNCYFFNNTAQDGAGVYIGNAQEYITFSNLTFSQNTAFFDGGGIYISDSVLIFSLTESTFTENTADYRGGGIYVGSNNDAMTIFFCNFTKNMAYMSGGGIYFGSDNTFFLASGCILMENSANSGIGGGMIVNNDNYILDIENCVFLSNSAMNGGGVHLDSDNEHVTFKSSIFSGNTATASGAGVYVGIACNWLAFEFCSFTRNAAIKGGAVFVATNTGSAKFQSCSFYQNAVGEDGGGVYAGSENKYLTLTSCNFTENTAGNYGGGLVIASDHDYASLSSCSFAKNVAGVYGGGMHVGSDNLDLRLDNVSFVSNAARYDGGALSLMFDNWRFAVQNCMFIDNTADASGGAIHSALQNNDMIFSGVSFVNNSAKIFGGAIYIGEDHDSLTFNKITARGCSADGGGGLYFSRFTSNITISSSVFESNYANSGAGIMCLADSLTIESTQIEYNVAVDAYGGIYVAYAKNYMTISRSVVSHNKAGSMSGGLSISQSNNITVEYCSFEDNHVTDGSGGAVATSMTQFLQVRSSNFSHNSATSNGGAWLSQSQCSNISFIDTVWNSNTAAEGGALYIMNSFSIALHDSEFTANEATAESGSAIYLQSSSVLIRKNTFDENWAAWGGTVFWEHASGMHEPEGLRSPDNTFLDSNSATYGRNWATEAHHTRLLDDSDLIQVVDYGTFAPKVEVIMEDWYNQVVLTDSSTLVTVSVPTSEVASCYGQQGFISGTSTVAFSNGTASFLYLEPLCAPNHTLGLVATSSLSSIVSFSAFEFGFRSCIRGEYYAERICNPCEAGTFSFVDPVERSLSDLSKSAVCEVCPSQASQCYMDIIELKPGYWRSDDVSTNILECPWHIESCRGGRSSGDASCGQGYRGPVCAVCEDGYHFISSSRTCEPCENTSSFFDPSTVTLLILFGLFMAIVAYGVKVAKGDEAVTTLDGLIAVVLYRLKWYNNSTYAAEKATMFLKTHAMRQRVFKSCVVYITFYQIVSTLPFIIDDVDFPDVYEKLMSSLSIVNLGIYQESVVSCSSGADYDFVVKLVVSTTVPVICMSLLWLCCRVHLSIIYKSEICGYEDHRSAQSTIISKYVKAMLLLTFLILPAVSVTIFQVFSCHNVGSHDQEDSYMAADHRVSCDSERYLFAFWWAVAMVFVYPVGIPLLYFCILRVSRVRNKNSGIPIEVINMLCEDFTDQYWFWTVVDAVYRVVVTGVLVLFKSTSDTIMAGMMLSLVYLKMVQLLQPFIDPQLNVIKETTLWQIYFVFLIALLIKMDDINSDFLTFCLMFTFFFNFIIFGGIRCAQHWKKLNCISKYTERAPRVNAVESDNDIEMEYRKTDMNTAPTDRGANYANTIDKDHVRAASLTVDNSDAIHSPIHSAQNLSKDYSVY